MIASLAACLLAIQSEPQLRELWKAGQDGYSHYRIPALLTTPKGTLLAFCEGRVHGPGDRGDIDLLLKRSEDGGKTWSAGTVVHGEAGDVTVGNPCPVVDARGRIHLLMARDARRILHAVSDDDGRTWSAPKDVSATASGADWGWVVPGPGVGLRLELGEKKGRLVIPADFRRSPSLKAPSYSYAFFSDDHGETWAFGEPLAEGSNECQAVELENGQVLMNMRMKLNFEGKRAVALSDDGGGAWKEFRHDANLPDSQCQGSVLRYSSAKTAGKSRILFCNPAASDGRRRLTVRLSYDEGVSWAASKLIFEGSSAYSCLAVLPDGRVALLFEGAKGGGKKRYLEALQFTVFSLAWLTDGQDAGR